MTNPLSVGTVRATVPKPATDTGTTTSATSSSEVGTVGTVFPDCTYVRAGMNKERARDDFPETGGQLSPTVPTDPKREFDVYRQVFPFGAGEWLDRIQAKDRPTAEQIAKTRFGSAILVVLAFGSKRRAQRTTAQELARKSSPHRRSR